MPKDLKNEFHGEVIRTSSKTKLSYLMEKSDQMIKRMKHEEHLRIFFDYNPMIGLFASHGKLWDDCAFYTAITINLIILMSYSQYFVDDSEYSLHSPNYAETLRYERLFDPRIFYQKDATWTRSLIVILGIIELAFSSLVVFFFLVKRAPLKVHDLWVDFFEVKMGIFTRFFSIISRSIRSILILL